MLSVMEQLKLYSNQFQSVFELQQASNRSGGGTEGYWEGKGRDRETQRNREINRHTQKERDEETETHRQRKRQTDRETQIETHRKREKERKRDFFRRHQHPVLAHMPAREVRNQRQSF